MRFEVCDEVRVARVSGLGPPSFNPRNLKPEPLIPENIVRPNLERNNMQSDQTTRMLIQMNLWFKVFRDKGLGFKGTGFAQWAKGARFGDKG